MFRSFLIGLVAGSRSMTPLAAVSLASAARRLPRDNGAPGVIARPLAAAGAAALAVGELFGDKMRSAPDRIVPAGMAARLVTGAIAGAALAPRRDRILAGVVGASAAVFASYLTFGVRMKALRRYGQTPSGLVEDALVLVCAALIVAPALRRS
jgi:uncharacterized membrane protein